MKRYLLLALILLSLPLAACGTATDASPAASHPAKPKNAAAGPRSQAPAFHAFTKKRIFTVTSNKEDYWSREFYSPTRWYAKYHKSCQKTPGLPSTGIFMLTVIHPKNPSGYEDIILYATDLANSGTSDSFRAGHWRLRATAGSPCDWTVSVYEQ